MLLFLECPDHDASVPVLCMCTFDDGDTWLGVLFLVRRGGALYTSGSSRLTGFEAEVPIASNSARVGGGAQPIGFSEHRIDTDRQLRQKVTVSGNGKTKKRKHFKYITMYKHHHRWYEEQK